MINSFISSKGYDENRHFYHPNYRADDEKNIELWKMYDGLFYDFLFSKAYPDGGHEAEQALLKETFDNDIFVDKRFEDTLHRVISDIGLDNYVQIVNDFNEDLRKKATTLELSTNNQLLGITPVEIPKHNNVR
jgi:hypothetical protein